MKSAIYLDEGNTQLVLSHENEWEKNILRMLNQSLPEQTYWGEFYSCQGGWIRQSQYNSNSSEYSLIIRVSKKMEQLPKEF